MSTTIITTSVQSFKIIQLLKLFNIHFYFHLIVIKELTNNIFFLINLLFSSSAINYFKREVKFKKEVVDMAKFTFKYLRRKGSMWDLYLLILNRISAINQCRRLKIWNRATVYTNIHFSFLWLALSCDHTVCLLVHQCHMTSTASCLQILGCYSADRCIR